MGPMRVNVIWGMMVELLFLAGASFAVSKWTEREVDIYEKFLTWLWRQTVLRPSLCEHS